MKEEREGKMRREEKGGGVESWRWKRREKRREKGEIDE